MNYREPDFSIAVFGLLLVAFIVFLIVGGIGGLFI